MPIFEYRCRRCDNHFEALVRNETTVVCPSCKSRKLEKQLSVFAPGGSDGTSKQDLTVGACGTCGDPRGPGSCSLN
ncbi:MAG: zinc ribbon domain-containing protein [Blastocatellia bacterium]|nr:MAG: zinc ribbon domain-containing protein [Blastocatellia bacterium]